MKVELVNIGKRYNRNWIFKNLSYCFEPNQSYAIIGNNGSGKSTLLQIIFNFLTNSQGEITYSLNGNNLSEENLTGKISFTAPYLDLLEDFTLSEILAFNFSLVEPIVGFNLDAILQNCGLAGNENKQIKAFSSGMKQRLKLILAVYSNTPLLLLDEPCSNLDESGIAWYKNLMQTQLGKRTILIASNQQHEYGFCVQKLNILDYK